MVALGESSAELLVVGDVDEAGVRTGVDVILKLDPGVLDVAAVSEEAREDEVDEDDAVVTFCPLAKGLGWCTLASSRSLGTGQLKAEPTWALVGVWLNTMGLSSA